MQNKTIIISFLIFKTMISGVKAIVKLFNLFNKAIKNTVIKEAGHAMGPWVTRRLFFLPAGNQ